MSERVCPQCGSPAGQDCWRLPSLPCLDPVPIAETPKTDNPSQEFTDFPRSHQADWCGEHQPREAADE